MASVSTSGTQVLPDLKNVYSQLLGLNQQNYQNVLGAYGAGSASLNASLPGIYQGYGNIENQITNTLGLAGGGWGVAAPAAQDIQRAFTQANAKAQQGAISAGLGNSTVLSNLYRGNASEAGRSFGALGANLANTMAGYQSQLGQGLQAARMQGVGIQTGLAQSEGGALSGYHFANTAGNLTGPYSSSTSTDPAGGRGGGGGSMYGSPSDGSFDFMHFGQTGIGNALNNNYTSTGAFQYPNYYGGGAGVNNGQTLTPGGNEEGDPNDPYDPYGNNYAGSGAFDNWYD